MPPPNGRAVGRAPAPRGLPGPSRQLSFSRGWGPAARGAPRGTDPGASAPATRVGPAGRACWRARRGRRPVQARSSASRSRPKAARRTRWSARAAPGPSVGGGLACATCRTSNQGRQQEARSASGREPLLTRGERTRRVDAPDRRGRRSAIGLGVRPPGAPPPPPARGPLPPPAVCPCLHRSERGSRQTDCVEL